MNNVLTIFRRETAAYFNSAVAYIFIVVFVLLNGGLFMTQFFLAGQADMRPFFFMLPFTLAAFLPAVTMGSWAQEKKGNTLELLLTFPMSSHALVAGKFLAGLFFYLAALFATLPVPVMLAVLGNPDPGMILSGYAGAILLGAFFLAAGIFISGLASDQISAFILGLILCFAVYLPGMDFFAVSLDGWLPGAGTFVQRHIAAAGRYETFVKGVIDNRDLVYFLLGTLLFLMLNGFWLEARMRPRARWYFSAACAACAGIFVTAVWLAAGLPLGRFDLTEGGLYTISEASRRIIRDLKAPATATLYISRPENMPAGMKTLEQDIAGKLEELKLSSQGRFRYKVVPLETANLAQETSLEHRLAEKGIEPFQVQSVQADEVGVSLVYAAMEISYKEKASEILPRIMPETLSNLEYLVLSRLFRMTLDKKPVVAVVAPFEEASVDPALAAILSQLGGGKVPERFQQDPYEVIQLLLQAEGYEMVRTPLNREQGIPEEAQTLVVLEPRSLEERQRYEISRFLASGGAVFMAVQNYIFSYDPSGAELVMHAADKDPQVNALLEPWGLGVSRDILADEQSEIIQLGGGLFNANIPVKTPVQIVVTPGQMNDNVSLTSNIAALFYLWGSALDIDEARLREGELELRELFRSSRESWTVPYSEELRMKNFDPASAAAKGPFPLAVMVKGKFPHVYEGKPVPEWNEIPAQPESPAAEAGEEKREGAAEPLQPSPGKLVLMGAATPFQKNLIQTGGHAHFFINAMDVLTLGEELIGIRSKQSVDRTMGRIPASRKALWKFVVVFLMPLIFTAAGAFRALARRREKRKYLKTLVRREKENVLAGAVR